MNHAIHTENLCKKYRKKYAVKNLCLDVKEGSIFGFLGPNGAGKTTTIKMLMHLVFPSSGESFILDQPSRRLKKTHLQKIGYVSENQTLPEWMTVEQLLRYCSLMYPCWDQTFCETIRNLFHLPLQQKIKHFSRGMKMKTALLASLAYRPKVLILDEPFSGLDVLVRDELIAAILELTQQENWTVFISSHDMDEVERLADSIGMIHEGRLHVNEAMDSLQNRFRRCEVILDDSARHEFQPLPNWSLIERDGNTVRFIDDAFTDDKAIRDIKDRMGDASQIFHHTMSLRQILLHLLKINQIETNKEQFV